MDRCNYYIEGIILHDPLATTDISGELKLIFHYVSGDPTYTEIRLSTMSKDLPATYYINSDNTVSKNIKFVLIDDVTSQRTDLSAIPTHLTWQISANKLNKITHNALIPLNQVT